MPAEETLSATRHSGTDTGPISLNSSSAADLPESQVLALYGAVGWTMYTDVPETLLRALGGSSFIATAWDDGELIGMARAISDDATILYVQDVLVHPDHQRKGIGRELVTRVLDRYTHVRQRVLLTDREPAQISFYESLGFATTESLDLTGFVHIENVVGPERDP